MLEIELDTQEKVSWVRNNAGTGVEQAAVEAMGGWKAQQAVLGLLTMSESGGGAAWPVQTC